MNHPLTMRKRAAGRRGVATSEAAVILPIMLALTFGTMEITSFLFLKESVVIAAHEGARVAIRKNATVCDVQARVQKVLKQRNVDMQGYRRGWLRFSRNPETTRELQAIRVTVVAPIKGNTLLSGAAWTWVSGRQTSASCTMYKEYTND